MLLVSLLMSFMLRIMMPVRVDLPVDPGFAMPIQTSTPKPTKIPAKTHTVTVSGFTYHDSSGNGQYDAKEGEQHLPFMQILVYDSFAPTKQLSAVFSDASGNFSITATVRERLVVKVPISSGFTPLQLSGEFPADTQNLQFGFRLLASTDLGQLGTIQGEVFEDKNGNQTKDSGEDGMSFSSIYLTDDSGDYFTTSKNTQTTEDNGGFLYEHLPLGKIYKLKLVNSTGTYTMIKTSYDIPVNEAQKNTSGLEIPVKRN